MNTEMDILNLLHVIRKELAELMILKKDVLNLDEACEYLSVSASHLYKLTSTHQIPCYQPNGKRLYFKRNELQEWLLRNRKCTSHEIEELASSYILSRSISKGGVK